MRQLFISYARENKPDVEALVRDLDALGYQTWVDSSLQGGQTWWEEILRRIGNCDVFVAIVSGHTMNSVACKRELEWALALNKPVLPLAVERLPDALPRTLSMRQIVNYSRAGREAAFALAGALGTLPAAPPPPEQLPEPPPAPLSYLSDLVEQVGQAEPLTQQQQRQILMLLEPALRSADAEERRGGRYVLEMFSRRGDLYADVDRTLAQRALADHDTEPRSAQDGAADVHEEQSSTPPEAPAQGPGNLLDDPRWADALSAFFAERWAEAVERFETLQASYPGEGRVETRLKEARRQRDIDVWSSKAEASAAERDWDIVVTALENLTALDPAYPDVGARLEQARMAQRRKALVDEMTALHQAGRWNGVVAAARELARIDPDNSDPGGIVSDAQAKIHEAELADRYAQALNHLDQEQWQQAADLLAAIEQEQPGYRDAAALLTTAQRQRDLAPAQEDICAVDPTIRNAGAGLEQARSADRLRSLVDKVTALHQAGRWKDVVAVADELAQLDPDDPDPDGMVSDARAKLREAELVDRYAQGVNHLQQGDWQEAIRAFTAIEQEQPGYRDAAALLRTAQQRLRGTADVTRRATPPLPLTQTTTPAPPRTTTPPVPVAVGVKRRWQIAAVSVGVVALVGGLTIFAVGHSSNTSTSTSTPTTLAPSTSTQASDPNETIADYIKKSNIQETTIAPGAPGAPKIDLPVPEGWTRMPDGADAPYFGIVFNTPTNPDDSPKMIATVAKLTGNVDTDKLLAAAPDEVTNLPGYAGYKGDDAKRGTLGGFPASRFSRSYTKNGVPRLFFQNTVAVEGKDGTYLLQLKAEGPEADAPALSAAELVIVQKTMITP
jgi:tetratricopeptide (TPR) repeat protein